MLDYFDAFQIGLTATPDNRTFGYFNQNLVSDYGYEKAVIDGVLVPYNVFTIETKITKEGGRIALGEKVDKRERLTRRKFWESKSYTETMITSSHSSTVTCSFSYDTQNRISSINWTTTPTQKFVFSYNTKEALVETRAVTKTNCL